MTETQLFYQAIGEIYASLLITSSGTKLLDTGERQYQAIVPPKIENRCQKYEDKQAYWRVYPQLQDQHLVFQVVSVSEQSKIEPGRFFIQGDWPNSREIEIWRNADPWKVNARNWQPRRLPISWQDAPPADGAFWQLQAQLVDGALEVINATGPFPHPPRLEALPKFKHYNHNKQQQKQNRQDPSTELGSKVAVEIINWEELTPVSGKLELTIKINNLPQVQKANGVCHFLVECDGRTVKIGLKQKQWTKIETANASYAEWIAAISGKMGAITSDGFVLEDANVQVFERKSKAGTQTEQMQTEKSDRPTDAKQPQATGEEATQTKLQSQKTQDQAQSVDADKLTAKIEPQPKKIGKFNVQIR